MSRPKKRTDVPETRERILEAAETLFTAHGYYGVSLSAIADDAGIRAPSLVYHFATKGKLFAAVVRRLYGRLATEITSVTQPGGAPLQGFLAVASVGSRFAEEHKEIIAHLAEQILTGDNDTQELIEELIVPLFDRIEGFLRAASNPPIPANAPVRDVLLLTVLTFVLHLNTQSGIPTERIQRAFTSGTDPLLGLARGLFDVLQRWDEFAEISLSPGI